MKWKTPAFIFLLALACQVAYMQDDDIDVEEDFDEDDEDSGVPELEPMERPVYKRPEVDGSAYFSEAFDSEAAFSKKWVKSAAKKDDVEEEIAKYDGVWKLEEPSKNPLQGDIGLVLKSKAKHHAIAAALSKHVDFSAQSLYIQYEVKFQNGQDCGGAYIKLLSADKLKLEQFKDSTPYTIMFGPDKCGNDNKLHFIFRHKNPVTGEYEEKHAKKPNKPSDTAFTDKKTHLYTLALNADNTFEIFVDQDLVNSGSLLEDFEPSVNPPKQIVDPEDKKPEDWDEREKIPDPDAVKPDDWDETQPEMIDDESAEKPEGWLDDEPELIPDPDAEMPGDWDEDMDGEWEAPLVSNPLCESAPGCGEWTAPQIKNPLYKGKWRPEMIENPSYQGKWKARMIDNPHFFEDKNPYKMTPIGAIGLELWSMSNDIVFDNFIITHSKATLDKWSSDTWELKHQVELSASGSAKSVVDAVMDATKDRPWLWAVFIVVIVLPVVLLVAYCCMSGGSSSKSGSAKKTDAVTPDDEEDEATGDTVDDSGDSAANGDSGDGAAGRTKTTKSGKSQLETAEDTGEGEGEEPTEESPKRRSTRKRNKPQKE